MRVICLSLRDDDDASVNNPHSIQMRKNTLLFSLLTYIVDNSFYCICIYRLYNQNTALFRTVSLPDMKRRDCGCMAGLWKTRRTVIEWIL